MDGPESAWMVRIPVFRQGGSLVKVSSQGGGPAAPIPQTGGPSGAGLALTKAVIYFRSGAKLARVVPDGSARVELADWTAATVLQHASADGRLLYSRRNHGDRTALVTHDAATGAELKSITLATDGEVRSISVHPDGNRIAVDLTESRLDLWMMEGFPRPAVGWERLFWRWLE